MNSISGVELKKGDIIELKVDKYAYEGKGVSFMKNPDMIKDRNSEGFIVFVRGAYPGDVVSAKIVKKKKSFAEAIVEKNLTPSQYRTIPRCKFFNTCGGCRQQDLIYEQQIKYKQQQVEEIFLHGGGLTGFEFDGIIPSEKKFFYRNKMEFSFSDKRWLTKDELNERSHAPKDFALGLHVPRVYDKILDIDECFLQSELSNQILNFTRDFFKGGNISTYSTKTHTGYLRNLVVRQAQNTDDLLVNIVTSEKKESLLREYTASITNRFPEITSLINNINEKKAAVAIGDYEIVYHGSGFIYDKIGEYKFRISANSFFQTNTLQAEKLYETALRFAELKGNEVVYDLYSGAGTIAIYISKFAEEIYGIENVESSIFDANENLEINKVQNVKFIQADLYKSLIPSVSEIPKPDVIILDPPRSGMHKNTVADVINLSPQKIVYISCNPTTQARDIKMMTEEGYKLVRIQPVDMFPHTFHIENVALLHKTI